MKSILLFFLLTASLLAQWSNDPNVNTPVVIETNDQTTINAISDEEGGIIMVWIDDPSGNFNNDIYAQKLDKFGNPQWAVNGVPICTATNDQLEPVLIGDGSGGAIITWYDVRNSAYSDIYAQKISTLGNIQWTVDGIEVCTAYETQRDPKIISDGAGGAIIVWQDFRNGVANQDIFVQKVSSAGSVQWGLDGTPVCTASDRQTTPVIVSDESGGAIITWSDDRAGNWADIYAQKVDAAGNMLWAIDGIVVCNAIDLQFKPQIVHDGSGGAIITWQDYRTDGVEIDLYAQWINSNGNAQWQNNGVAVSTATRDQIKQKIINDNSDGVIISWEDVRTFEVEFYAQRLNSQGNALWAADGVKITNTLTDAENHVLIDDGSGGAIIAWQDGGFANYHIYAQKINSDGILQWSPGDLNISSGNIFQEVPFIVRDLAGGAIIAWEDLRNASNGNGKDIYAQQVSINGNLGEIVSEVELESENPQDFSLEQNYPNPFNPSTKIGFRIANFGFVSLKVYDVLSNEVATLVNEEKPSGTYEVHFNAKNLSSGIYFYKLQSGSFVETRKMILLK